MKKKKPKTRAKAETADTNHFREFLGESFTKADAERLRAWVAARLHLLNPQKSAPQHTVKGNPPHVPTATEQWRRDGLPGLAREMLESSYGFADWRLALCLVVSGKDGKAERTELAEWLLSAVEREDGDELRAFAKCLDALGQGKRGTRSENARALALHVCRLHFAQTGRTPSQAWVRRYLVKHGFPELGVIDSTMRKNEARDIFWGLVLGSLRKAKGGHPKTSVNKGKTLK